MKMESNSFDAQNITALDTIAAIRARPQMYVGDIKSPEITNILLQEILCLSLDKAEKSCATEININFSDEGILTVRDNGFPLGIADYQGKLLIETLLTELFACRNLRVSLKSKRCNINKLEGGLKNCSPIS